MAEPTPAETPEKWNDIGQQIFAGGLESVLKADLTKFLVAHGGQALGDILAILYTLLAPIGIGMAEGMSKAEDLIAPAFSDMAAAAVRDVFNVDISSATFERPRGNSARRTAGEALGKGLMEQLRGSSASLEPSDEAAARYVGAMASMALEDWFKGWFFEVLSSLVPQLDVGKVESYGALGDKVANVLGLGRLSNRILRPVADAAIVTPLEWKLNKTYRSRLLTPSEVVRQVLRGKWTKAEGVEELARQGFSDRRIEALFNAGQKFFSPSDVRTFYSRGEWDGVKSEQHLRDQGYDGDAAVDALRLEGLKRFEQHEGQEATAIVGAYASRDIDRPTMLAMLADAVTPAAERALLVELADVRRAVNVRRLSLAQVEAMVRSGVLSVRDYRAAAERDGYPADDVTALELQLRWELDKEKALIQHRAELEAERAAAKAERDAALAARKAEVERQRALARRGTEADLERAAVRGKIPLARVEEVYAAHYDSDTVQALLSLVEDDRQAYLDRQAALEAARNRHTEKRLDTGALEQAFLRNLLTVEELRGRLGAIGYDAGDADLLVATAVDKKADADALAKKRAAADKAAAKRRIDLGRFERLVRKGARTMPQYVALLESLDVDEAAIPDFVDALQVLIDDDAAAREARARAAAAPPAKGLTLEQLRRAVLLGVKTVDDYSAYLIANRFTSDAQAVLLAELAADVADAEAARQRRVAPAPEVATPGSPLSTIRRAAQLGLIPPDVYLARLVDAGYSDEDLEIETELLLTEIADVQATRRQRDAPPNAAAPAGLSLAALERAVKAGAATLGDYRARAVALGYQSTDIDVLIAVVEREQQTLAAAKKAHDDWGLRLAADGSALATLDSAVKEGALELVDYVASLEALGVPPDEAQLVGAYVAFTTGG